jgi:hypothetical protein
MVQSEDVTCAVQGNDGRNNFSRFTSKSLLRRRRRKKKKKKKCIRRERKRS